jgi:hypothetical protein
MAMQTVKIKSLKIVMPSKTGEGRGRERFSLTLSLGLAAAVLSSSGARLRSFPFGETGGSATGLSATGARDTALAGDAAIISPCGCGLQRRLTWTVNSHASGLGRMSRHVLIAGNAKRGSSLTDENVERFDRSLPLQSP